MALLFYTAGTVAVIATALMLTRADVVHALLDLVVSLLAVAVAFAALGAPFVAALEVIVYAGAIMVLFLFAVMMLDLGRAGAATERRWLGRRAWAGPLALVAVLAIEVVVLLARGGPAESVAAPVGPREVGRALYGPYLVGVELASLLLTAALIGASHLAGRGPGPERSAP
jgi:NADH-quinone oxidoreductase subunit J